MKLAKVFLGITLATGLSAGAAADAAIVTLFNGTGQTIRVKYEKGGLVDGGGRIGAFGSFTYDTGLKQPRFTVFGDDGASGPGFARAVWTSVFSGICVDAKIVYVRNGAAARFLAVNHGTCGAPTTR